MWESLKSNLSSHLARGTLAANVSSSRVASTLRPRAGLDIISIMLSRQDDPIDAGADSP
jgi:hypothetical protein